MDSAAPITPPDQTQTANAVRTLGNFLNAIGFHVLVILLGIAQALM